MGCLYFFLSLIVAYLGGFLFGGLQLKRPFRTYLESESAPRRLLSLVGIETLLEERPLSYEIFKPRKDEKGHDLIVFLELRMRDDKGYYIGQLSKIGLVGDSEPHKPIYLKFAKFRQNQNSDYEPIKGDGIWLDLADVLIVTMQQTSNPDYGQA